MRSPNAASTYNGAPDTETNAPAPHAAPAPPSGEPPANGHDTGRATAAALAAVQARPDRDAESGRFVVGNTAAGTTLARSEALWEAVEPAKAELVERLRDDLAVDGAAATTLGGLVEAYAEARLLRSAMFNRLVELGGPVTGKGKARALFATYLSALDRETRLATTLGLERRARQVDPVEGVRRAVAEANR